MKSEPDVYSILNLKNDKITKWEGVRNYQARNFMMKSMAVGDLVYFYHSNANPSGIAGVARVSKLNVIDQTQFDPQSEYYDPKASLQNPRWFCVEVEYVMALSKIISLEDLRQKSEISHIGVLQKGQRLSVLPISEKDFNFIFSTWIMKQEAPHSIDHFLCCKSDMPNLL